MLAKTINDRQYYWLNHLKAAGLSDETIDAYATSKGISLKRLYHWKIKLTKLKLYQPVASDFIAVKSTPE